MFDLLLGVIFGLEGNIVLGSSVVVFEDVEFDGTALVIGPDAVSGAATDKAALAAILLTVKVLVGEAAALYREFAAKFARIL
jgi:hypothetical protein